MIDDLFKPYSPELREDLEEYLREYDGRNADNRFCGAKYFFEIRDKGLMIPGFTLIRVCSSPVPDVIYSVNDDFMLESSGRGKLNMSAVGAEKGVYDPRKVLKKKLWSIHGLNLE